jgi:KaiC/GvpD/RAD55 family RecA-like ATPase
MNRTPTPTLDDVLGGALPGRIHLLTGTPGSGKSSAALHFLHEGIGRREHCALLTVDRTADLLSHALHVGFDVRRFVRARRLTLVRYRSQFAARMASAASGAEIVDELRQCMALMDEDIPREKRATQPRIVIDTVAPFLASGDTTGAGLAAIVDWLDECGATAVITYTGDVAQAVDRRLEPVIERAALIARLHHVGGTSFRAEIVRARHAIASARPIAFEITPGVGIATARLESASDDAPPRAPALIA